MQLLQRRKESTLSPFPSIQSWGVGKTLETPLMAASQLVLKPITATSMD